MGLISDMTPDLGGINPDEMAGHFRAVSALTPAQLRGMLGWSVDHEGDADMPAYDLTYTLLLQAAQRAAVAAPGPYHVMAVQDHGGTQEHWTDWPRHLSRDAAEQVARDMAEADRPCRAGYYDDDFEDREARFRARYGDEWLLLSSGNVCPGWNAIFIEECTADCAGEYPGEPLMPFWMAADDRNRPQAA